MSQINKTMKKIVYIIMFAFVCALSFSACTEEEVKPNSEVSGGIGGGASD